VHIAYIFLQKNNYFNPMLRVLWVLLDANCVVNRRLFHIYENMQIILYQIIV